MIKKKKIKKQGDKAVASYIEKRDKLFVFCRASFD